MKSSANTLRQEKVTTEGKIKLALSLSLCIYAIVVSSIKHEPIALAMIFSFMGDALLMKKRDCFHNKNEDDFASGVACFMMAHFCYHIMFETPLHITVVAIIACMILVYAGVVAGWGIKKNIVIISIYSIVLISSVVNTYYFNTVAFIGGLLFFISDGLIGIFMLAKKNDMWTQVPIWVTYVPAQILLLTGFLLAK